MMVWVAMTALGATMNGGAMMGGVSLDKLPSSNGRQLVHTVPTVIDLDRESPLAIKSMMAVHPDRNSQYECQQGAGGHHHVPPMNLTQQGAVGAATHCASVLAWVGAGAEE
eukprot:CAMPEP_0174336156 /NCGR_PEP_ID=MMETSP0810-20121108/21348_1 /TAXON_ID=73025 ORGANISM="Eutreptiella gymnastica-like, Strain CCMP1594" /NCGR_SAMPLE_ID=MMETSP0810 /ASSEMBLY_ACC=CAM_ASM_000659 /LENGTH=110 /DNA_ID=CAMNT_0015454947 /DNA_START=1041 /DNA_END=1374 /DNA_ORIENTATION=-